MTDIRAPTTATWPICLTNKSTRNRTSRDQIQDRVQITFVTHLTENGVDRRFIQEAVGHRCDTSTAIYTHVSGDFMNTALRKALTPAFEQPNPPGKER
ncbi:MAG: tyrosine-type recombinase/integrase [Pseudonocardiaceae bacterium]